MQRDLYKLPKADLHCHLEGCARPETIRELASKYGVELGELDAFDDLITFLANYKAVIKPLVRSIDDLARIGAELIYDRAASGAVYCEPMWTPHTFTTLEGLKSADPDEQTEEVFARVNHAMRMAAMDSGIEFGHLMGVSKAHPEDSARIAQFAVRHKRDGVVSFGMYGNENLEHEPFRESAAIATHGGLLFVPHAGEVRSAESVDEVLTLGAHRVAHGVRAVEDQAVVDSLRSNAVACDVCITSNLKLGVVAQLASHPVIELVRAKVPVTLGTDDSLFFGASLLQEYELARKIGFTDNELAEIARSSITYSGLDGGWRDRALAGIDKWLSV